jgi:hypothetical protein
MLPRAETAHWLFAGGFLFFGLVLLAEAIVGPAVVRRRAWRACLWPSLALLAGVWLWVITIFSTFSTIHLLAHAIWAEAAMIAGAVQLAVVRGKLRDPRWALVTAGALLISGTAFLVHEANPWLYSRSAFLHHVIGWTLVVAAAYPVGQAFRPRRPVWSAGFALTFVVLAALLFSDRDAAPIFGHFGEGTEP